MQKFIPNLWFAGNAEAAGEFYAGAFPRSTTFVESRYPTENLLEFQKPLAGQPLTVTVVIDGFKLTLVNGGQEFSPNPSISFTVRFDPAKYDGGEQEAKATLDEVWEQLADGGNVMMPLESYEFSQHYGWVQDAYGVSWQFMLVEPDSSADFIVPCLMFGGAAQNWATEAVDTYVQIFEKSALLRRVTYPNLGEVTTADSVMFSEFALDEQVFSAMDSAVAQPLTFSPGVSLEVQCADQEEIDRIWDALSAVPEAEQCGWLTDKFGVSWQIVPRNMGELMAKPGAFQKMLQMKKLIIADF